MTTDIRRLLDQYFEGNTSAEEEKALRRYFAQDDLPGDLQVYAPVFRFLDDESAALAALNEIRLENNVPVRRKSRFIRKLRTIAAVAAALVIAAILLIRPDKRTSSMDESYVWVDGKQITDPATVRKYAEISFSNIKPDEDILEEQLSFMLE